MVKRLNLNPDEASAMADLMGKLSAAARAKNTPTAGVKDLGAAGDVTMTRPDGTRQSMRELDSTMALTRAELADATAGLQELNTVTLPELQEELGKLDDLPDVDWSTVDFDAYGRVSTTGPPPADPIIGQSLWVAPNGSVFRAVECEEETSA